MIFISLEGLDCSGKTTIGKMIKEQLIQDGFDVLFTREPGGEPVSEKIRDLILDKKNKNIDAWTEALLYIASRRQHLIKIIIPALKKGTIILCDRFMDSTTAYQGAGRGISISELDDIQNQVLGFYKPDLTIFFNISPEDALARMSKRTNKEIDRMDLQNINFFKSVYEGFLILLNNNPKRIKEINATKSINDVFNQCYSKVREKIEEVTNERKNKK